MVSVKTERQDGPVLCWEHAVRENNTDLWQRQKAVKEAGVCRLQPASYFKANTSSESTEVKVVLI